MSDKLKVIDIFTESDNRIVVNSNRYGGGYTAVLVYDCDAEAVDMALTGGDYHHHLGTLLLEQLNIPHAWGNDPLEAVTKLMSMDTQLRKHEFFEMFLAFKRWYREDNNNSTVNWREIIESGEYAKNAIAAWEKEWFE